MKESDKRGKTTEETRKKKEAEKKEENSEERTGEKWRKGKNGERETNVAER